MKLQRSIIQVITSTGQVENSSMIKLTLVILVQSRYGVYEDLLFALKRD